MRNYSTKAILIAGFGLTNLIMIALIGIWVFNVVENEKNIKNIYSEQKQTRLVADMRESARRRALMLHRMAITDDDIERDEIYMEFSNQAGIFIGARDELLSIERPEGAGLAIWKRAQPFIRAGESAQREAARLILDNQIEKANKLLHDKVIPIQNSATEIMTEMFAVQKSIVDNELYTSIQRNDRVFWFVIVMGSFSIFITITAAIFVIRRAAHTEQSLICAREEAQAATRQKSQFLANMSHEIRTPLTAVLGFADSLQMDDAPPGERKIYVNKIVSNGEYLLGIINDILDFSKIEANQLNIENISVSPIKLLLDVESLMSERARLAGLEFNVDFIFPLPASIQTDPTRLKQILFNLCGNAIKFTDKGSVDITVNFDSSSGQMIFVVSDTGTGMSQEQQNNLFHAFSQGDISTTRKYGGTGLGLSISRQLAKLLGGSLTCQSKDKSGSLFTLAIDVGVSLDTEYIHALNHQSHIDSTEKTHVPSLSGSILLAEDMVDNQALIKLYVERTGAEITIVDNGKLAVEKATENNYDLILMDMQMPVMNGEDAVACLRKQDNNVPIAMLTANAMAGERINCLKLGANEFLIKPINSKNFYKVLSKYLKEDSVKFKEQGTDNSSGNSEDDISDLVDIFIERLPSRLNEIKDAMDKKDWSIVMGVIHNLKGTGSSFGFPEITKKCNDIEKRFKLSGEKSMQKMLDEFLDYCNQIISQ